jgi:hypothetical protein
MEVGAVPQNDEDSSGEVDDAQPKESPDTLDGWQRVVRCPITGRRVVASRPGQRKITSEEIYALLGEEDEWP